MIHPEEICTPVETYTFLWKSSSLTYISRCRVRVQWCASEQVLICLYFLPHVYLLWKPNSVPKQCPSIACSSIPTWLVSHSDMNCGGACILYHVLRRLVHLYELPISVAILLFLIQRAIFCYCMYVCIWIIACSKAQQSTSALWPAVIFLPPFLYHRSAVGIKHWLLATPVSVVCSGLWSTSVWTLSTCRTPLAIMGGCTPLPERESWTYIRCEQYHYSRWIIHLWYYWRNYLRLFPFLFLGG